MTKKPTTKPARIPQQLYLYGLEDDKPRGARFPVTEMDTVFPVMRKLGLQFFEPGSGPAAVEIGQKLPVGRIYARGKAFIPNIKRELYDEIVAVLAESKRVSEEKRAASEAAAEARAKTGEATAPPILKGRPQDWQSVGSGHLVLIEDVVGDGEGWWEATCLYRSEDVLTLRYRDYPEVKPVQRHISNVALLHAGPQPENDK
jgi:hypothetical protein